MEFVYFSVKGKPKGKGRPRFAKSGAVYTPQETKDAEDEIRWAYRQAARGKTFGSQPVRLHLFMVYGIPQSATKTKREKMMNGELFPMLKPDADNCLKLVCDALNGIAYNDDAQIVNATVTKRYTEEGEEEPCIIVVLSEAEPSRF